MRLGGVGRAVIGGAGWPGDLWSRRMKRGQAKPSESIPELSLGCLLPCPEGDWREAASMGLRPMEGVAASATAR